MCDALSCSHFIQYSFFSFFYILGMIIPSCNVVYGTVFEEKLSPGKESDTRVRVHRNGGRVLVKIILHVLVLRFAYIL